MKRLKIIAFIGLLACVFGSLFTLSSCGADDIKAPKNLKVDLDHVLTWNEVDNARIYKLEITNTETKKVDVKQSRKESVSLASYDEGIYTIRVQAISGNDDVSDWSKTYEFHKPYETGCIYELVNNSEYHIVKVGRAEGKIMIEPTYRGKPVTAIADEAFKNSSRITEVVMGENVTSIGEKAFYNCRNLVSITKLDSVLTIGKWAFQGCTSLTEIKLPKAIEVIDEYTFSYCRALTKVTLNDGLTTIGYSAFSDCTALESIKIPNSVVTLGGESFMGCMALSNIEFGIGVTEIGEEAFYHCQALKEISFPTDSALKTVGDTAFADAPLLEVVKFPEGTESIGVFAFYGCAALEEIELPSSLKKIGKDAFLYSKLYDDQFLNGEPLIYADNWLVDCFPLIKTGYEREDGKTVQPIGLATEQDSELIDVVETEKTVDVRIELRADTVGIADEAMINCQFLKIVILPESVQYIGDSAFENCPLLWKLQTAAVKNIGVMAFYKTALSNLQLGEGLERIEDYAFYASKVPSNVKLPVSLVSVGAEVFNKTPLWNKKDTYGVIYADKWVVGQQLVPTQRPDGSAACDVVLREDTVGIADYTFYSVMSTDFETMRGALMSSIINLEKVQYIGRSAFYGCFGLGSINLHDGITRIDDYAFYQCASLSSVDFPESLESIGRSAFYQCAFTTLDLSVCPNLQTIEKYAFFGCGDLAEINLGNTVTEIGDFAFYQSAVESLTIPDSVTSIGVRAFYKNESLKSVTFGNSVSSIGAYAFSGCVALESIVLPDSVKTVENNAFYNCTSVKTLDLGKVQTIGKYAFFGLENLESLAIPQTVEFIGAYAFKGAGYLKEAKQAVITYVLLNVNAQVEAHAFYGIKGATFYMTAEAIPDNWAGRWNSSYRPVIWGCGIQSDENGEYVHTMTVKQGAIENTKAKGGLTAPEREGYVFKGWATEEDGEVVYSMETLLTATVGTTLYAIWDPVTPDLNA